MQAQSKLSALENLLEKLAIGTYTLGLLAATLWVWTRFGKEEWLVWLMLVAVVASGWYVLVRVAKTLQVSDDQAD